jgi:hypothetical protein
VIRGRQQGRSFQFDAISGPQQVDTVIVAGGRGKNSALASTYYAFTRDGAEITVLNGVVMPSIEDSPQPFELVIRELSRRRTEHPKGSLQNEMFKQLGNSLYGKLGQGIKGTNSPYRPAICNPLNNSRKIASKAGL